MINPLRLNHQGGFQIGDCLIQCFARGKKRPFSLQKAYRRIEIQIRIVKVFFDCPVKGRLRPVVELQLQIAECGRLIQYDILGIFGQGRPVGSGVFVHLRQRHIADALEG